MPLCLSLICSHLTKFVAVSCLMKACFSFLAEQFNLQKESLLQEFDELKNQLRFSHLASCFGTSSEAGL